MGYDTVLRTFLNKNRTEFPLNLIGSPQDNVEICLNCRPVSRQSEVQASKIIGALIFVKSGSRSWKREGVSIYWIVGMQICQTFVLYVFFNFSNLLKVGHHF